MRPGSPARQEFVDAGTIVDLDEGGRSLGIEIISPENGWPAEEIIKRFQFDPGDAELLLGLARKSFAFSHAERSSSDQLTVIDKTA